MSFTPFAADEVFSRQAMNARMTELDAGGVPRGIIAMWSGAADAVPAGWALCNGSNGTPDLRGRFVLGAGGTYAVGAKGGEETHTLTAAEMPKHSHDIGYYDGSSSNTLLCADSGAQGRRTSVGATGSSQPHNNMPPYYALYYIMKL